MQVCHVGYSTLLEMGKVARPQKQFGADWNSSGTRMYFGGASD